MRHLKGTLGRYDVFSMEGRVFSDLLLRQTAGTTMIQKSDLLDSGTICISVPTVKLAEEAEKTTSRAKRSVDRTLETSNAPVGGGERGPY